MPSAPSPPRDAASSAASGACSSRLWRIPKPPPRSATRGVHPSASRQEAANDASRTIVSAWASKSASCEPTWTCSPSTSSSRARASSTSAARLRGRQPELRAVVPGADRLVRVGVDAERDAHEHAPHSRRPRRAPPRRARRARRWRLPPRPRRGNASSLLFPWTTISSPREPGRPCERELAEEATSAPIPSERSTRSTATLANAFVPNATCPPAAAVFSARARARRVSSQ